MIDSETELDAALNRLRIAALRKAARARNLAFPPYISVDIRNRTDGDLWRRVLNHNAGFAGTIRRIPIAVINFFSHWYE